MHQSLPGPRPHASRPRSLPHRCALALTLTCLSMLPALAQGTPHLSSVNPANGATGVPVTTPLVFEFDQPMMVEVSLIIGLPGVFVGNFEISPLASAPSLDGTWSDDGLTLTCAPSSDWPANTKFTWKLNPAGSVLPLSSEGGIPLATASGSFTTGEGGGGGGGDAPVLRSSDPATGATEVPVTAAVKFVFDVPMKKVTALGDSLLWQGTGLDPAKFAYSWSADGLTLTCDYAGDLPAATWIAWALNPEGSSLLFESEAGEPLAASENGGGFMTAQGGGGGGCTPDGIPADWGGYSVSKGTRYVQTAASDPAPAAEMPFYFGAFVMDADAGPKVTGGSVTLPTGAVNTLQQTPPAAFWYYSAQPASEAALNAAFPAGTYTLRFTRTGESQRAIAMTMPSAAVPVPKLANYPEAQAVNHAQPFTLQWNSFTGAGANDRVSLVITDMMGRVAFQAPDLCIPRELPVTSTSIVLPANTLANNATYHATLTFGRTFYFSTNAVPDMAGMGSYSRETEFTIRTGTGGTATPARFTGYRMLPDGNPEMTLTGTPLSVYTIQRSGSVGVPGWSAVGTAVMDGTGNTTFVDTQPGKVFPAFYRAVAP